MLADRVVPDGDEAVVVVEGNDIADVAVSMGVDVYDTGGSFLETCLGATTFASHLTIYYHDFFAIIITLLRHSKNRLASVRKLAQVL